MAEGRVTCEHGVAASEAYCDACCGNWKAVVTHIVDGGRDTMFTGLSLATDANRLAGMRMTSAKFTPDLIREGMKMAKEHEQGLAEAMVSAGQQMARGLGLIRKDGSVDLEKAAPYFPQPTDAQLQISTDRWRVLCVDPKGAESWLSFDGVEWRGAHHEALGHIRGMDASTHDAPPSQVEICGRSHAERCGGPAGKQPAGSGG